MERAKTRTKRLHVIDFASGRTHGLSQAYHIRSKLGTDQMNRREEELSLEGLIACVV